jgi:putative transposase
MPRQGLRLGIAQERDIKEEYQRARAQKDLDMCLSIQGLLLVHRGNPETVAADTIGVGRRTLQDWIQRYRKRGVPGLVKGSNPCGKSRLTERQRAELSRIIAAGPGEANLDTCVWMAPIVVELVKDLYGVSYSCSHVRRILHNLGFSLQYPTRRVSKTDEKANLLSIAPLLMTLPEPQQGHLSVLGSCSTEKMISHQTYSVLRQRYPTMFKAWYRRLVDMPCPPSKFPSTPGKNKHVLFYFSTTRTRIPDETNFTNL